MNIENLLNGIKLPDIYKREGKDCYFDVYRKKLIEITPEETIRQKIAALFEYKYGVPKDMITLESPMSHYVPGVSGRADIIIHAIDIKTNEVYPIAVVECKNRNVILTDQVVEQAIRYCDTLGGNFIFITNGIDLRIAVYDNKTDSYIFLDEILSYEQMLNNEYELPEIKQEKVFRFTFDELQNQSTLVEYNYSGTWIFGEDTCDELRTIAVNFYQALLDVEHKLPLVKRQTFELIEDIGLRYMDYSNAGGGHFNGIYRSFLVKDRFKEPQIVSLSLFGTDSNFRGENRKSYTSLTAAIDRFKSSHNSLQYNVDRFVELYANGKTVFSHNGQISSMKSEEVLNIVFQHCDGLKVDSSKIVLGEIDRNKLFFLDNEDISHLTYNIIEYALLRDEVRRKKQC